MRNDAQRESKCFSRAFAALGFVKKHFHSMRRKCSSNVASHRAAPFNSKCLSINN